MDEWMNYNLPDDAPEPPPLPPLCPRCHVYHIGICPHDLLDRTLSRIEADYASAERGRAQNAAAADGEGE